MNMKLYWFILPLSLILAFGVSGCCGSCDKGFIGDFGLAETTPEWMTFPAQSTRVFVNQDNEQLILTYRQSESGFRARSEDCEQEGNCGLCCAEFNVGFLYTELTANDLNLTFQITIEKNLITHTTSDPIEEIDDFLTITIGNRFGDELFGLPDTNLVQSTTLNDKSFSRVFSAEDDISNYDPATPANTPISFYFTKEQGIVGFKTFGGDIWALTL